MKVRRVFLMSLMLWLIYYLMKKNSKRTLPETDRPIAKITEVGRNWYDFEVANKDSWSRGTCTWWVINNYIKRSGITIEDLTFAGVKTR